MNCFKWFFMSKYSKLLYQMKTCKGNKQRLHLQNGIVLDFNDNIIMDEDEKECNIK